MYIFVLVRVSLVESTWPSVVAKGRRLGLARKGRTSEGGPSSFSRLHWLIFAFQASFCTSIALGPLLIAFLLLWSVNLGCAQGMHLRIPFLCWERAGLVFVWQAQEMMLTSVCILSLNPRSASFIVVGLPNAYRPLIASLVALEQRVLCR